MTDLEARLRNALGQPLADHRPDPERWAAIERRIGGAGGVRARHGYRLVVAATLAVVALSFLALHQRVGDRSAPSTTSTEPAQPLDGAVDLPTAPSPSWLVAILAAGIAAVAVVELVRRDRLVTVAAAAAATGVLLMAAFAWPHYQSGVELAASAPELDGYVLVEADLDPWPDHDGFGLVRLVYARPPGAAEAVGGPEALTFDARFPSTDRPCLRIPGERPNDPRTTRYYCPTNGTGPGALSGDRLEIAGSRYVDLGLFWPRLLGYPLFGLAAILVLLRSGQEVGFGAGRRVFDQWAYGVALMLAGVALYFVGLFALSVVQVGRPSVDELCGPGLSPFDADCRQSLYDYLRSRDAYEAGNRLYGPVVWMGNIIAFVCLGLGSFFAVISDMSRRRRVLLVALGSLVGLGVVIQVAYGDTISVMTDLLE